MRSLVLLAVVAVGCARTPEPAAESPRERWSGKSANQERVINHMTGRYQDNGERVPGYYIPALDD